MTFEEIKKIAEEKYPTFYVSDTEYPYNMSNVGTKEINRVEQDAFIEGCMYILENVK